MVLDTGDENEADDDEVNEEDVSDDLGEAEV